MRLWNTLTVGLLPLPEVEVVLPVLVEEEEEGPTVAPEKALELCEERNAALKSSTDLPK